MTNPVSVLFPGMSARGHRQAKEMSWVVWFLLIGWWFYPIAGTTWILWVTIKYTALAIAYLFQFVKEVRNGR